MVKTITAEQVKQWLGDGAEIAFIDVREHGQYGEGHPFFVVSVPYSRLELHVRRLVPRRTVRVVLLDDGDGVAARAAQRLAALGYTDLHEIAGGMPAWRRAGYGEFQGVHVPSKTFGELVEHAYGTPHIQAQALADMMARGEPVVVLDGRPVEEFRKMNIPGATCCPNAELPLRLHALVGDGVTPVVVNCAGRTRSIMGAQTLISAGVSNPVYALENGTQGWYLNDLALEHGQARCYPEVDYDSPALAAPRARAAEQAARHGAADVDAAQVRAWLADAGRTTYLFDVRTREEFEAGTLPGAEHAPGGQLLQGTDLYVGVKGARLVLADDEGIRARLMASWLRQMGHETYVLPPEQWSAACAVLAAPAPEATLPVLPEVDAAGLSVQLGAGPVQLIDVRGSMAYRRQHLAGAVWSIRPRLAALPDDGSAVVLVAESHRVAALAAMELTAAQRARCAVLTGGPQAWLAAGLDVVSTPDEPTDAECIDFLFFVHDRHDGNKEAARQYLAWETGLIDQLDEQERAVFRVAP